MMDLLSFENTLFASFVFHASLNLAKMLAMGPLTSLCRLRWKVLLHTKYTCFSVLTRLYLQVFSNPEDCRAFGGSKVEPKLNHPVVERMRR